jgi:hypothetical protein
MSNLRVIADGINYPGPDGNEVRAKKGDIISLPDKSMKQEIADGTVELYNPNAYVVPQAPALVVDTAVSDMEGGY